MATLTVQKITRAGITPSLSAAAAGGDEFTNDGRTYFHVNNGSGSGITVTVVTQKTVDGKAVADDEIAVGAGAEALVGPFPPSIYNDAFGRVQVAYSGVTSVTVGAFRLP